MAKTVMLALSLAVAVAAHPDRWAAIVPIVGTGNVDDVETLAREGIPTWLIGSGTDPVVKPRWLYYAGEDLYLWPLSHRLPSR